MEKTIAEREAEREFARLIHEVVRGNSFVVEREGEPVAAVVPFEVYEKWKKARDAFFEKAREAAERANLSPEEADALVNEAVRAVRSSSQE